MGVVLGINLSHDTSVCLIKDGEVFAAEEERWSRIKHNSKNMQDEYLFPEKSLKYVLEESNVCINEISLVVCVSMSSYDIMYESIHGREELKQFKNVIYITHHKAHILSGFLLSPFNKAVGICVDGAGSVLGLDYLVRERVSGYYLDDSKLIRIFSNHDKVSVNVDDGKIIKHKNSLGRFYENFARRCIPIGDEPEGSMMALAAYAENEEEYYEEVSGLIELFPEGHFQIKGSYATDTKDAYIFGDYEWILGEADRIPFEKRANMAAAVQRVYEETMIHVLNELYNRCPIDNLVISGGCALNSKFNGVIKANTKFKNIYVPPAPNDGGVALGAALYAWNYLLGEKRIKTPVSSSWGPKVEELSEEEKCELVRKNIEVIDTDEDNLYSEVARLLADKNIIVWCRGRMEFGPRALGNRSIIAHPGDVDVSKRLNRIKRRAEYRPLAPSILKDRFNDFFFGDADYYMNKVAYVKDCELLAGCSHKDNSARVQLVDDSGEFFKLLQAFEKMTNLPIILNTSLNMKGIPIARDKEDAIDIFEKLDVDAAVIGNSLLVKRRCRKRAK
ncbi:MAG: hypothetical protein J5717_01990 [Lachnospiraceae bacterium]|nr:hypothetical protein [Lachnospiraceae bacterium]